MKSEIKYVIWEIYSSVINLSPQLSAMSKKVCANILYLV